MGVASWTWPNGNRYDGEFRDGKKNGHGVITRPNGDRYDGEFRDGKNNGHGALTLANGVRYDGGFRDDKYNGRGVMTWPNGDRYDGEFLDDKRNGYGVYTRTNGERRAGQWHDGQFAGGSSNQPAQIAVASGQPEQVSGRYEIPLRREGGVLVVPVKINDTITLNFTIDSGAADVSIPADVVLTLIRAGTISEADFLGKKSYVLADGSTVPSDTFRIRSLRVGEREITNVTGSVAGVKGSLLLGQSFLSRFNSWSIDNSRQMLVLN